MIKFIIVFLLINITYGQNKELYVVIDDTTDIEIRQLTSEMYVFSFAKEIPKEKYKYDIFFDKKNNLNVVIPIHSEHKSRKQLNIFLSKTEKKLNYKDIDIIKNKLNSNLFDEIKFESLKTILNNIEKLYFIESDNSETGVYSLFRKTNFNE